MSINSATNIIFYSLHLSFHITNVTDNFSLSSAVDTDKCEQRFVRFALELIRLTKHNSTPTTYSQWRILIFGYFGYLEVCPSQPTRPQTPLITWSWRLLIHSFFNPYLPLFSTSFRGCEAFQKIIYRVWRSAASSPYWFRAKPPRNEIRCTEACRYLVTITTDSLASWSISFHSCMFAWVQQPSRFQRSQNRGAKRTPDPSRLQNLVRIHVWLSLSHHWDKSYGSMWRRWQWQLWRRR